MHEPWLRDWDGSRIHRIGWGDKMVVVPNTREMEPSDNLERTPCYEDIAASDRYTLKSDSSTTWTSFPSRILETVCTKNDATATYGVCLKNFLYGWKYNFITFPTPPDSGPYLFGANSNSQNNSTSRIRKRAAQPLLGQWPVYRVGP